MDSQLWGFGSRGRWGELPKEQWPVAVVGHPGVCAMVSRMVVNITYCVAVTGRIVELFILTLSGPRLGPL